MRGTNARHSLRTDGRLRLYNVSCVECSTSPPLDGYAFSRLAETLAARITTFALEAYLHQLREDGYSVFVVRGDDLPPAATEPREGSRDCWYRVKDLLEVSRGGARRW